MRTTVAGSVILLALALAGFASARLTESLQAQAAPPAQLRDCRTRSEGRSPQQLPSKPGVRIGPLLFWPSIKVPSGADPGNGSEWPFVQKAPVVLAARTKLVLAIAPEAQGFAAFQSRRGGYVSAIRFERPTVSGSPAFAYKGTVGRYTGFPFAIGRVARSVCVPMDVWVDEERHARETWRADRPRHLLSTRSRRIPPRSRADPGHGSAAPDRPEQSSRGTDRSLPLRSGRTRCDRRHRRGSWASVRE